MELNLSLRSIILVESLVELIFNQSNEGQVGPNLQLV